MSARFGHADKPFIHMCISAATMADGLSVSQRKSKAEVYVCVSWAILVAIALTVHPFVYSDEALQLKALHQYVSGESPTPNQVVTANPSNLAENSSEWITWWPPS